MMEDEIDFEADKFEDIVAKDARYDGRAYAVLMDVVRYLISFPPKPIALIILENNPPCC